MTALFHALEEHRDALYADIEHYFDNRSLLEWHRDEMPLIELQALFDWLPAESKTKTLQTGVTSGHRWSDSDWMAGQQLLMMQTLVRLGWMGSDPPKFGRIAFPSYETPAEKAAKEQQQAEYDTKVADLRQYRPAS